MGVGVKEGGRCSAEGEYIEGGGMCVRVCVRGCACVCECGCGGCV